MQGQSHSAASFPQYFTDAADAAAWLLEQQSALESTSCGQDQAAAEALLQRHPRLERTVRTFGAELRQLDEQAQAAAARASLAVSAGTRQGPRPTAPTVRMLSACAHLPPPRKGRKCEGFGGPVLELWSSLHTPPQQQLTCYTSPEFIKSNLP